MQIPVPWEDDPECGHRVAHEYQTHYCSYIRAPVLLSLQRTHTDFQDEILAVLAVQAIELWLKVIRTDLTAAFAEIAPGKPKSFELTKLLSRAATLIRLLDRHSELAESILLDDLELEIPLSGPLDDLRSEQLRQVAELTRKLEMELQKEGVAEQPYGQDFIGRSRRWAKRYQHLLAELFERGFPGAPSLDQYLATDALLNLDQGVKGDWASDQNAPTKHLATEDPNPDEIMFIVVHQVFELWFKAAIHELESVLANLLSDEPRIGRASRRMRRVVRIQTLLADMIHIPATMLPMDFLRFRTLNREVDGVHQTRGLTPASGTESYQFRELEIMAGLRESVAYREFLEGNPQMHIRFQTPKQAERLQEPSLAEAFDRLVEAREVEDLADIFSAANVPNPHADLAELADLLLEFDQFFQLWRFNHLTMVQSMIGRKSGTGYLGPEYLKETVGMGLQGEDDRLLRTPQIRPRFFEDLWEVRTRLRMESGT